MSEVERLTDSEGDEFAEEILNLDSFSLSDIPEVTSSPENRVSRTPYPRSTSRASTFSAKTRDSGSDEVEAADRVVQHKPWKVTSVTPPRNVALIEDIVLAQNQKKFISKEKDSWIRYEIVFSFILLFISIVWMHTCVVVFSQHDSGPAEFINTE